MIATALCAIASSSRRTFIASAFAPGSPASRIVTAPRHVNSAAVPRSRVGLTQCNASSSTWSFRSALGSLFSTAEEVEEVDPGVVEGTDLVVLKYPHPALRATNEEIPVEELTGPGCEISKIAKEMFLVMYATNGVGLAAPQVGINKRLMVYNESGDKKKWMQEVIMINPKIVEFSPGKEVDEEGCLSFPDMHGDVERSKWIKVEALNNKGKKIKKKFKGWEARIFQHEYDHLNGVVYVDRLTTEAWRKEVQPKLDDLVAKFGEGGAL